MRGAPLPKRKLTKPALKHISGRPGRMRPSSCARRTDSYPPAVQCCSAAASCGVQKTPAFPAASRCHSRREPKRSPFPLAHRCGRDFALRSGRPLKLPLQSLVGGHLVRRRVGTISCSFRAVNFNWVDVRIDDPWAGCLPCQNQSCGGMGGGGSRLLPAAASPGLAPCPVDAAADYAAPRGRSPAAAALAAERSAR